MNIVVVGAGQVGGTVARELSANHEITIVDSNPERLDELRFQHDVMTVQGNGARIEVLEKARTAGAELVIASTNDDRVNILVAATAHALNPDLFTIARVTHTDYLKSWEYSQESFSVDLMVGSDYLTARAIVEVLSDQPIRQVAYFAERRIEMVEFDIPDDAAIANRSVQEIDVGEGLRLAAVFSGDHMEVVTGTTMLDAGSRLLVIGRPEAVQRFGQKLTPRDTAPPERIMIFGGGEIAHQTALLLEQQGLSPNLVVPDRDRAHELADELVDSLVFFDNPSNPDFLKSEGIDRTQLALSVLREDEANLMASLLARNLGADRVFSVVNEQQFQDVFEQSGVEVTFNPRNKVIEEIIRHTRSGILEKVTFVEHHRGEVIEVELSSDSPLVARSISSSASLFPDRMVIGALSRSGRVIIPTGDTVLEAGDDLVVFVNTDVVSDVLEVL